MKKFVLRRDDTGHTAADFTIPYAELLNEQQLRAVMFDRGSSLVIAGAGTGKTRTLVYRVSRLIESGVDPSSILLLTFTRRASREMLDRASAILDARCHRIRGGTFHYYCNTILHRYASRLGFPENFTIIDTSDALDVLQLLRTELKFNKLSERFPNKNSLLGIISTAVNRRLSLHEVVSSRYEQFLVHIDRIEQLAEVYSRYKFQNKVMDFDDLLVYTLNLLQTDAEVRNEVAAANRHVLVDEYQDTNALQADLVKLFSSVHRNVMAVGDDAQSIYAFRGADHRNIMQFPEIYPDTAIIKLEENYRSVGNVLTLANNVLELAKKKYEKKLFTRREAGELPALVRASDEREQSRFIAQMILNLREQEISLNDVAVLFRNSRDSFDLEIELGKRKIPYVKYGGQKFSEAAHIKDVLAHLRVVVNVDDAIAWNRVLTLVDGIGPKTAGELIDWINTNRNTDQILDSGIVSGKYRENLSKLFALLQSIRGEETTPGEAVERIIAYYKPVCEKKFDDYPKRLKDLESFSGICINFSRYQQILDDLVLDPIEATVVDSEPGKKDEEPLILSTIHSAKGLEWEHVFIIQCLDGVIPSGYALELDEDLDEELRLLYVAVTRAREQLYITYPVLQQSVYGEFFTKPSRFIDTISDKILEPWMLVEEKESPSLPEKHEKPALPQLGAGPSS
ncbi:MAG: ATP-dependent helicase [Cyclonatronaceae bacterium]